MSKREAKLKAIIEDLRDSGFEKDVPREVVKQAIMRNVGFSEATVKQYLQALKAFNLMVPNQTGTVWVIQ